MSIWGLNNFYTPIMPSFMPACNPFFSGGFAMPQFPPYAIDLFMPLNNTFSSFNPFMSNPFGGFNNIFGNNIFSGFTPNQTPILPDFSLHPAPSNNIFGFLNSQSTKNDIKINTTLKLPALKDAGYNKQKGEKLARIIGSRSTEGGFDNYCARNVKEAIEDAGLGKYEYGHGYQVADILADNKNFKEVSAKNINLSSLPAGCVLVYDRGVSGYSSQYGHTEITLGNGTAASGGITHNIRQGARVFIPV